MGVYFEFLDLFEALSVCLHSAKLEDLCRISINKIEVRALWNFPNCGLFFQMVAFVLKRDNFEMEINSNISTWQYWRFGVEQ